jgi:hypothetical protein
MLTGLIRLYFIIVKIKHSLASIDIFCNAGTEDKMEYDGTDKWYPPSQIRCIKLFIFMITAVSPPFLLAVLWIRISGSKPVNGQ